MIEPKITVNRQVQTKKSFCIDCLNVLEENKLFKMKYRESQMRKNERNYVIDELKNEIKKLKHKHHLVKEKCSEWFLRQ